MNKLTKTNNETEDAIDQPKLFARKHHNHHHHNLNEKENRLSRRTKFFSGSASSLNSESATESQISDNGGFLSNLPHINYTSQKRTTIAEPLSRYDLRPFNSKTSNTAMKTLSQELAEELEVTKDILVKHNMPMNRTLIRVVREYICKYGSVQAFKNATINVNNTNLLFSTKTNHQHHGHHKVQTPSPSRHTMNSHHQHKQQTIYQQQQQTSDDNSNADAPPKPPRRPLPKINFT